MYTYTAKNIRVIDGDTIEADVDLGFSVSIRRTFRLYGINAPEMRGESREAGIVSKNKVKEMISLGDEIEIQTIKDHQGKYGRYLAVIIIIKEGARTNLNEFLVINKYAITENY